MNKPLVSICCITYNHALFIHKCLDGFLMQQPPTCIAHNRPQSPTIAYNSLSSWLEILIHDDASTDGTAEIIKEYEAKYPDIIKPIYEIEGVYHKPGKPHIDWYNYHRAQGKYIAYCEGDDYWTDPQKLQKQVDFMESHPEYSVCFHGSDLYYVKTGQLVHRVEEYLPLDCPGVEVSVYDYFHHGLGGQPLTMLFRMSAFSFEWQKQYAGYRDTHEIYHLLRSGKGYYLNFIGGVYVKHQGGVSTSVTTKQSCKEERDHILELYLHNRQDKVLADYLKEILLWNYDVYKRNGDLKSFWKIWGLYILKTPYVAGLVLLTILKRTIRKNV